MSKNLVKYYLANGYSLLAFCNINSEHRRKMNPLEEKTVVLIKPDGVRRAIIGEIITRFEKTGLKIVALKMIKPARDHVKNHYPNSKEWIKGIGEKSLADYKKNKLDPVKEVGTEDPMEIGKICIEWLFDYMSSDPVIAIVFQGNDAINQGRKIVGSTVPVFAEAGTIRGDFSKDSAVLANMQKRGIKNVVHASGSKEEAEFEISHWFSAQEIVSYRRADEEAMFA